MGASTICALCDTERAVDVVCEVVSQYDCAWASEEHLSCHLTFVTHKFIEYACVVDGGDMARGAEALGDFLLSE